MKGTPEEIKKTIKDKELETLAFWEKECIFEKSVENPRGSAPKGDFSFYDGPPFATGLPHHGHVLAGSIKDVIPRYKTMQGFSVRRVWGWDCHGLPIENLIEKELGLKHKTDIEKLGVEKFNRAARESVLRYEKEWKEIVPRLGRFVDMEHAYKTMDPEYTESIWWSFSELHKKGLIYEGYKIMHICPRCETSLAQSEVALNYKDVTDLSLIAKFELIDEPNTYILAWTTTPWTLPGNVALAVKEDAQYLKVKAGNAHYIFAKDRLENVEKHLKALAEDWTTISEFSGKDLIGKKYKPLFPYYENAELSNKENIYKVWSGEFVTLDTGTGIVHIAPAFGGDDMELAKKQKLPVIKHVNMDGTFTKEVTDFQGVYVKQKDDTQSTDILVIKYLAHHDTLFSKEKIVHSYPLCWRCDTPLLNYATNSWFVDVPKIKDRLVSQNQNVTWVPEHIRDGRFGKWLEGAREWAISRTRYWGAPLPVWRCNSCNHTRVLSSISELAEGKKAKNEYILMRHGEAKSNVSGILDCKGDKNNTLTSKGKEQVQDAIKKLNKENIDLIIASPFARTEESAELIRESLGLQKEAVFLDDRLREINMGIFDGKSIKDMHEMYPEVQTSLDARVPEGESHREVLRRVTGVISDAEKNYEGKKILIITHSSPALSLIFGAHGFSNAQIKRETITQQSPWYLTNGSFAPITWKVVPRNEYGELDLHRPYVDQYELSCSCGKNMRRIPEIFDCWYESGSMPYAEIHYPFENKELFAKRFPAQWIAEGVDQTRGWFYSLIVLSVALFDKAPFEAVTVNGHVLASDGEKMSKSKKNFTDPIELVSKYGADALRYALLSSPVVRGENVAFSDKDVEEAYRKIIVRLENIASFYDLYKEDGEQESNSSSSNILDVWALSRLSQTIGEVTDGLEAYHLDTALRPLDTFVDDLSVWYLRRSRDRLKGDTGEPDRKHALSTLRFILLETAKLFAPIMPFVAERIHKALDGKEESVHLAAWPKVGSFDEKNIEYMKTIRATVSSLLQARTKAGIKVRQPLSCARVSNVASIPKEYWQLVQDEVNVKEIIEDKTVTEPMLDLTISPELKKEGMIREIVRVIQDARKANGFMPKDTATLHLATKETVFFEEAKEELLQSCGLRAILFEAENGSFEKIEDPVLFSFRLSKA